MNSSCGINKTFLNVFAIAVLSLSFSLLCLSFLLQAGGGPSNRVVGGETQAAGARSRAAGQILSGPRETTEGSSGPEEGSGASLRSTFKHLKSFKRDLFNIYVCVFVCFE